MARTNRLGRPPDADSALTRGRILDVARQLFAVRGYEATSNRLIAEEAGLTTGAIYHYFDRKLDIYSAVHDEAYRHVYDRFQAVTSQHDTFVGKLEAVLEASHALNNEDPSIASFLGSCRVDAARDPQIAAAIAGTGGDTRPSFFSTLVDFGIATGEIDPDQRAVMMAVIRTITVGLVDGVSSDRVRHRSAVDGILQLIDGKLLRPPTD